MINIEKIWLVRNWDHCSANMTIKYGLGRKRKNLTRLMLDLGEFPLIHTSEITEGKMRAEIFKRLAELGYHYKELA